MPVGREKFVIFSLPVHGKLCELFPGDGGCEGERVDCVDGDDIFDTGGTPKISTQSSRPSRRELDTSQSDDTTAVGAVVLVLDTIFIFQAGFVDIEIAGERIRFLICFQKIN